jgi:hypothetical protein
MNESMTSHILSPVSPKRTGKYKNNMGEKGIKKKVA